MKIFTAEQIRDWDKYTIANEPVSSIDLMERAAQQCTDWLAAIEIDYHPIKIFCGKGNNGGDGLAIARLLAEQGIFSRVYILEYGAAGTDDFQHNLQRLHEYTKDIYFIQSEQYLPVINNDDLVIDALYGSGLNRPLSGLSAAIAEHINQSKAIVVAIDIPSGLFTDQSSKGNTIVKAKHTLTFQTPKLAFLLPENEEYLGELHVLDINLHRQFAIENESRFQYVDDPIIGSLYIPRKLFSHKGTFGHALIIAGSKGKMGAAHLSAKACLRSGAGLLTVIIPPAGLDIIQTNLPEAMCVTTDELDTFDWDGNTTIGIGPGLGTAEDAEKMLQNTLQHFRKPMVIDADALNMLSQNANLMQQIPKESILTPHPKEYERLFGKTANNFERLDNALSNAQKLGVYILIKGHYSFIACPDGTGYFNSTGNPGMATAGSGDVLTGILTGLLSQGYTAKDAIIIGVYLHGLAGDIAAKKFSQEAMIAGDIIESLGEAYQQISLYRQ